MIIRPAAVAALTLLGLLAGCGENDDPKVPADDAVALSNAELQSRWWTWATTPEEGAGPVEDRTGKNCAVGQGEDVWFLAGTYGGTVRRTCIVPAETPIAAPAINLVAPTAAECDTFLSHAVGQVLLDGETVPLEPIPATAIDFTSSDGAESGFACGLWAGLDALEPGTHELTLRGRSGDFGSEAVYTLEVGTPQG